jgi:tetratricopeptide (TPR) repeat protein
MSTRTIITTVVGSLSEAARAASLALGASPDSSAVRRRVRGTHSAALTAALLVLAALAITAPIGGCASRGTGPYSAQPQQQRDPVLADRLTRRALEYMESNPDHAEDLLRRALSADLYHGPAHNNLGVLYLKQGKLYEAAGEFEWARKLMPGHPDPRLNLALTLETAGRTNEAIDTYRTALDAYPGHIPTMQALTRLQLITGRPDDQTPEHLREIALKGDTPQWRDWAAAWRARAYLGDRDSAPAPHAPGQALDGPPQSR